MFSYDAYHRPGSLAEALAAVAAMPPGGRVIAGGTDILPWARDGRGGDVRFPLLLDVSAVRELAGHALSGGRIRLGASVTFQDFLDDVVLRDNLPCMPFCSIWF